MKTIISHDTQEYLQYKTVYQALQGARERMSDDPC